MGRVTIIAEAGVCHNGDIAKALRLCYVAKEVGADIVKFQAFNAYTLFKYQKVIERMCRLALSADQFKMIARYCETINLEFMATPDDIYSLKHLVDVCGVRRIKLGSGSLLYRPLVDAAFDTGLPVLLSTGMATLEEIFDVVQRQLSDDKQPSTDVTIMHCVSLYPCPAHLADIARMKVISDLWFGTVPVGYSDHTIGDMAACAAVALGATVIEKHFTLDHESDGPDHHMAADPTQFAKLVRDIRLFETILGHGRKEPSEEELAMIPRIRKDSEGFQPGL